MNSNELTFRAVIHRHKDSKDTWQIKLRNQARFIVSLGGLNFSAILFDLDKEEIRANESAEGSLCLMDGSALENGVSEGDEFLIPVGNEILASGKVLSA